MISRNICILPCFWVILYGFTGPVAAQHDHKQLLNITSPESKLKERHQESHFRPMNSIRLSEAVNTTSIDGILLKTPEDSAAAANQTPAEQHFTAAPWHSSHPVRNTFPIFHQPLYFENANLERCGRTHGGLTEVVSAARFAAQFSLLPMQIAAQPPCRQVRALPDCPAGGRFPCIDFIAPLTPGGVAFQTAVIVGMVFLIP